MEKGSCISESSQMWDMVAASKTHDSDIAEKGRLRREEGESLGDNQTSSLYAYSPLSLFPSKTTTWTLIFSASALRQAANVHQNKAQDPTEEAQTMPTDTSTPTLTPAQLEERLHLRIQRLEVEATSYHDILCERDASIQSLQDQLQRAWDENATLRTRNATLSRDMHGLLSSSSSSSQGPASEGSSPLLARPDADGSSRKLAVANDIISESQQKYDELRAKYDVACEERRQSREQALKMQQEIQDLREQVSAIHKERDALRTSYDLASERNARLKEHFPKCSEQSEEQEKALWKLRDALGKQEKEIVKLQYAVDQQKATLGTKEKEIVKLQDVVDQQKATLGTKEKEIVKLQDVDGQQKTTLRMEGKEIVKLQDVVGQQKATLGTKENEIMKLQDVVGQQKATLGTKENEIVKLRDVADQQKATLEKQIQKLTIAGDELDRANSTLLQRCDMLSADNANHAKIEHTFARVQAERKQELEMAKSNISNLSSERDALTRELSSARHALVELENLAQQLEQGKRRN
ncbi:hypothetical protein TI39_contig494g00001 [Zymoseptoria brevis]|uniref:Uncharacterized protein n=1 Tax=Zymoseptoria brevis TaxID=1047168 RepID=A0A0F4GJI6_9PEZI|nr:hypothetical protein TI39_contig494g00001 [Zymoseptoria brevis]